MTKKRKWKSNHQHAGKSDFTFSYRKQPKEAFRLGKTQRPVWGGPFSAMQHQDWSVLICCNGQSPSPLIYASPQALQLMPKLVIPSSCPYIRLDWADLSTPDVTREFWDSLVTGLQRLGRPGPIGVCCMGGTGRTGTALAIIAQLSGAVEDGKCPVSFIRTNYAKDAVETREQGQYITDITGVLVSTLVEPLFPAVNGHGSNTVSKSETLCCVHGKPMHLFCGECLTKSGTMTNYHRDHAPL